MKKTGKIAAVLFALVLSILVIGAPAFASDDNSLASLGISTEGVTVTPDFAYDTWEYNVTVPAGTTELSLSPIPSSSAATIAGLSGTTLNEDGTGTVFITVQAGNGDQFTYTLHVTGGGPAPQPQQQAEVQTPETEAPKPEPQPQTEAQTEDNKYVRVERNTIQEAEKTITNLKEDITMYRDTISMYTKIMYGLIAVAVVLLFIVINLILKKKGLKAELNEYRSLGYSGGKKVSKAPAAAAGTPAYAQQDMKARQNHGQPQARTIPAQENVHYGNGGQLDVRPQTSQKKSRRLPEYQGDGNAAAAQAEARVAAEKPQAAVKPQKPSRKQIQEAQKAEEARLAQEAAQAAAKAEQAKGKEVQVDMIDL